MDVSGFPDQENNTSESWIRYFGSLLPTKYWVAEVIPSFNSAILMIGKPSDEYSSSENEVPFIYSAKS